MSIQIKSTEVIGEIDSLEETDVDFNKYVGIAVRYGDGDSDATTIYYCDRKELASVYYGKPTLCNKSMYDKESDDGNWSNSYDRLCTATMELLLGDIATYWLMDLARFYSDLLVNEPTKILTSMFKNGLTIQEAISGDVWCDAVIGDETLFAQLNAYDDDAPELFDLVAYEYLDDDSSVDSVDFSLSAYYAVVTEEFIREVYENLLPKIANKPTPDWLHDTVKLTNEVIMASFNRGFFTVLPAVWFDYMTDDGSQLYIHIHNPNDKYIMQVYTSKSENETDTTYSDIAYETFMSIEYIENKLREFNEPKKNVLVADETVTIPKTFYDKLNTIGLIPNEINTNNVGKSDYAKHLIQPWVIFNDHTNLNYQECDIIKRILRSKEGERILDLEKCKHILDELIRQHRIK